jgi:hypothetical protein
MVFVIFSAFFTEASANTVPRGYSCKKQFATRGESCFFLLVSSEVLNQAVSTGTFAASTNS